MRELYHDETRDGALSGYKRTIDRRVHLMLPWPRLLGTACVRPSHIRGDRNMPVNMSYSLNASAGEETMDWEFELLAGPFGGTTEGPAWDGTALLFLSLIHI